jgi:hypothetical protein
MEETTAAELGNALDTRWFMPAGIIPIFVF